MPTFCYQCSTGHIDIRVHDFDSVPPLGTKKRCSQCRKMAKRVMSPVAMLGSTKFGSNFQRQSEALLHPDDARNRPFKSVKEIDAFCKKNNLVHVGNSTREIKALKKIQDEA